MDDGAGCSCHNENDSSCPICTSWWGEPPTWAGEMFINSDNFGFQSQMTNQPPPNGATVEAQRRENIPFTIEEVVTLVQGVLDHGRGSWKKIKDEAFGNDSRRTRTDLRDKWKTLVHTANIPAHQRRGAVPPEWLLEIVRRVENGF